jgi:hypothetical protein
MPPLSHECDHLSESGHVDATLPGHHAAVGLEIKRQRLPCDVLARPGHRHHGLDDLGAIGRIADEAE